MDCDVDSEDGAVDLENGLNEERYAILLAIRARTAASGDFLRKMNWISVNCSEENVVEATGVALGHSRPSHNQAVRGVLSEVSMLLTMGLAAVGIHLL